MNAYDLVQLSCFHPTSSTNKTIEWELFHTKNVLFLASAPEFALEHFRYTQHSWKSYKPLKTEYLDARIA